MKGSAEVDFVFLFLFSTETLRATFLLNSFCKLFMMTHCELSDALKPLLLVSAEQLTHFVQELN